MSVPPKQKYSREMVLSMACELFETEGIDAINARTLSKALACSTQPIFSYFSNMDDLKEAVLRKEQDDFYVLTMDESLCSLEDHLNAYVRFAYDHPVSFHGLLHSHGERSPFGILARLRQMYPTPDALQLSVYAHGMSCLAASGFPCIDAEAVKEMLLDFHRS